MAGVAAAGARERTGGAAFRVGADVDCDDVSRAKSFPMFRAASQPDKSNSPTTTVGVIRPLIVIPCLSNTKP